MIKQLLTRSVATDAAVARCAQAVCFGGACLIPVLVFGRFAELELSEAELLIGVVATLSMSLVCTSLGVLLNHKTQSF